MQSIDAVVINNSNVLLTASPPLLVVYLSRRNDQSLTLQLWRAVLSSMISQIDMIQTTLPPIVNAAQRGVLPNHLRPADQELDAAISKLFETAIESRVSSSLSLLIHIVEKSGKPQHHR